MIVCRKTQVMNYHYSVRDNPEKHSSRFWKLLGLSFMFHSDEEVQDCLEVTRILCVFSVDLYAFFSKVQKLGGYNVVTANRMWKPIYDDLGGHQGSTSAATCTRRHYER